VGQVKQRGTGTPAVEQLVEAALRVIDAEGLAALTTVRLAEELGIFQSVIYRRVPNRDALLGLVVEAVMAEVGDPTADPDDWRGWLTDCAVRLHRTWLRHPHATPLLRHGGAHPSTMRLLDGVLGVLQRQTAGDRDAFYAVTRAYLGYVFGTIAVTGATPSALPVDELDAEQAAAYPSLAKAQLTFLHGRRPTPERQFLAGLEVVLDGLAPLMDRR
jgi:AcrR family transcriptional regulator